MKAPRTVTIALAALTIALANPATLRAAGSTTTGANTASHDLLVVRTGTVYGSLTILPAQSGQAARGLPGLGSSAATATSSTRPFRKDRVTH